MIITEKFRYNENMDTQTVKRKPGPPKRFNTVKKTVMLDADLADWAIQQPGGMSQILRDCLQERRDSLKQSRPAPPARQPGEAQG